MAAKKNVSKVRQVGNGWVGRKRWLGMEKKSGLPAKLSIGSEAVCGRSRVAVGGRIRHEFVAEKNFQSDSAATTFMAMCCHPREADLVKKNLLDNKTEICQIVCCWQSSCQPSGTRNSGKM